MLERTRGANEKGPGRKSEDLTSILNKARDFHGHFGPFLVIGVRAGLIGLKELQTRKEKGDLSARASLTYSVPYSCILDGIQVATGCTIGNKRLKYEDSSDFTISFENERGETATISILRKALDELIQGLAGDVSSEHVEKLAHAVASIESERLFTVGRKQVTF